VSSDAATSWQGLLQVAQAEAQSARFDACLATCGRIIESYRDDAEALLSVGAFLLSFGFLSVARQCFLQACHLLPNDLRALVNLANVAQQAGDHSECRRLYAALLTRLPDHPVIRRNALLSLEYDPDASDEDRLAHARAWGDWAVAKAGGIYARPVFRSLEGRPLRIGYVSADLCQHTVGLFVKDVLASHDTARVLAFAYSAGRVSDWVTAEVRTTCVFREVADLDDVALAEQIRSDEIDVLVDLSGHTSGSRLTVFARRPALVQVSWLGYFATTGLPVMDAVLLDEWHAPSGIESQFVESVVRLPRGRFCYAPVPFAPAEVAPSPCLSKGYVTFGCFNNTAKFNAGVFDLWAQILLSVPDSRLVLKWRTFQDSGWCEAVRSQFGERGIAPERLELRGASFHADVLKEYADIDIALDPFPFTGGLTSCEALWMGVPVVTWPQSRVVSRQTYAFMSAIGLPELAAIDATDYVRIAVDLAADRARLHVLRAGLRGRMRASQLCDVASFTRALEDTLLALAREKMAG
jgi:predicted O-linked N-acetylglucosamine transferase (SPINDLY family)